MLNRFIKLFKALTFIFILFLLYLGAILLQGTMSDYQPEEKTDLVPFASSADTVIKSDKLTLTAWNIGYAGLGAESDFFFDKGGILVSGGSMVYAPKELYQKNFNGICDWLKKQKSDFYLIQEIDSFATRSFGTNQLDSVAKILPDYAGYLGVNGNVARIPIPVLQPWKTYGKVYTGVATYGRFQPYSTTRLQLPGSFAWPSKVFQLDRCLLVQRYKLKNNKELVLINVHMSAHDTKGELKAKEMTYLRQVLMDEFVRGNYVIAGGDWNQCPPGFKYDTLAPTLGKDFTQLNIADDYLPEGWQWAYDAATPTNRKCRTPYKKSATFVTLIDFWLLSPNIKVEKVKTADLDFAFSDHQPVQLTVSFR